ncbi:hypothetical protein ACHAWF_011436 [Thalassiosira exigua]
MVCAFAYTERPQSPDDAPVGNCGEAKCRRAATRPRYDATNPRTNSLSKNDLRGESNVIDSPRRAASRQHEGR